MERYLMVTEWCKCWRTKWQFDVMADGDGYCKHCSKKIQYFFVKEAES